MITFNAERHEYADAETGEIIRSVTTVLKDAGLIDGPCLVRTIR